MCLIITSVLNIDLLIYTRKQLKKAFLFHLDMTNVISQYICIYDEFIVEIIIQYRETNSEFMQFLCIESLPPSYLEVNI